MNAQDQAAPAEERYSIADTEVQQAYVGGRRAAPWVGFFLPHLRPGLSVLDCGCGVGSITLDLAELVAPGQVVGVDVDASQLRVAGQGAAERALTNVSFRAGNVYDLPFRDASFDAVLAHTLLFHLNDRARALQEIRRVLRPGGVVGISDDNWDTMTFAPDDPMARRIVDLWARFIRRNGGDPTYSPQLRGLLLQAGFVRAEGHAVAADYYGTLERTRQFVRFQTGLFQDPEVARVIVEQGWVTPAEIAEMVAWLHDWGERPDAFCAVLYCAAVAWAP